MAVVFTIALLGAIGAAIFFGIKRRWKCVVFSAIAILVCIVGMGIMAPAQPAKTPVESQVISPQPSPKAEVKEVQEISTVAFTIINKDDPTLAKDSTKVIQEGVNGERTITYEVTYEEGKEQSRVEKSNTITKPAIDEIIAVGTYVAPDTSQSAPSGNGHTALCNDGTYSDAASHQGACSHHGGVSVWYR